VTIDDVIAAILEKEGGYVHDAIDRGGSTNMGITAATLGLYRQLGRPATPEEVKALTVKEATAIYRERYIRAPGFEDLPAWVLPIVVDDAVLSGPRAAITTLQAVLKVPQDGILGPVTKRAVTLKDPEALIRELVKARALRYARIVQLNPSQSRFIVGWLQRAFSFLT
jgi:lysozyme family protein